MFLGGVRERRARLCVETREHWEGEDHEGLNGGVGGRGARMTGRRVDRVACMPLKACCSWDNKGKVGLFFFFLGYDLFVVCADFGLG